MINRGTLGSANSANYNTNQDYDVPQTPSDGISSLAWSKTPGSFVLASTSWDKTVRIWDVQTGIGNSYNAVPKISYNHEAPVLDCDFSTDMTMLFSAGCDKKVKAYMLKGAAAQDVGVHDGPVRHVKWCEELKMIITGSWDKTLRFWDGKSPSAVCTIQLPERVFAMDLKYPVLVIGMAEGHMHIYNLENIRNSTQPHKVTTSNLKLQTRCVSIFTDKQGYATGSVEGRVHIAYMNEQEGAPGNRSFAFKCHRVEHGSGANISHSEIYPINVICFHPTMGTFATAGSDGTFVFWDKDNKQRLKAFNSVNNPISTASFSADGSCFAYAVSYDWHKGHEGALLNSPHKILLHKVQDMEIRPKANNNIKTNRR